MNTSKESPIGRGWGARDALSSRVPGWAMLMGGTSGPTGSLPVHSSQTHSIKPKVATVTATGLEGVKRPLWMTSGQRLKQGELFTND